VFRTSDLISGTMEPYERFDFGTAVPNDFVFSPNGRYLYGSSYYTGASNIFRYDL
jgi:Tol biopolymer transport system component